MPAESRTSPPFLCRIAALAAALALAISLLPARTLTVDDDGPADYRLIQTAIDAAAAGDVVSVAPGTYRENLRLRSGIAVLGAGAAVTLVDGGSLAPVARLTDCDAATRLEGFRLTGGLAAIGGGFRVERGAPVIRFNEITGNRAVADGAYLYGYGGGGAVVQSGALVSDNVLAGNDADFGGGLHLDGGAPRITRNVITGNTAGAGGGIDAYVLTGASPLIAANALRSNTAIFGGGLELAGPGAPIVTNNLIVGNTAIAGGAGTGFGGGVDAYYSGAHTINNTFVDNTARTGGGASVLTDRPLRLVNNILFGNEASNTGGAIDLESPGAAVLGNIFHLNARGTCSGSDASLCDEPSNLEADPLLVDPAGTDLGLRSGSPAIDTALGEGAPPDDVRGQRRPLDGDRDGAAAPDRGAHEYDRNEVPGLQFATPSGLSWEPVSGAAAYHVYSGVIAGGGRTLPDTCRDPDDDDRADLSFAEGFDPLPGEAFAYLVTAVIAAEEQSPGFDSRGLERILPVPCP
ncbi:MAG: choice-of-anchor Q domain-containing protein [Candidatus Polarisedimenticolia bacterium]